MLIMVCSRHEPSSSHFNVLQDKHVFSHAFGISAYTFLASIFGPVAPMKFLFWMNWSVWYLMTWVSHIGWNLDMKGTKETVGIGIQRTF